MADVQMSSGPTSTSTIGPGRKKTDLEGKRKKKKKDPTKQILRSLGIGVSKGRRK